MMRNSNHKKYAGISSFNDFSVEKGRLVQKSKKIRERIDVSFRVISKMASVSTQIFTLAKEIIVPKVSELFKGWLNKNVNTASGEENP